MLDNAGYEASLTRKKIYVILPDTDGERDGDIRIVDQSSEDYFPATRGNEKHQSATGK